MFKFDAAYAASHRSDLSQSQVQTWVSAANASMTRLVSEGLDEDSAKTAAVKEADKAVPAKTATVDQTTGELTPRPDVETPGAPGGLISDPTSKFLYASLRRDGRLASFRINHDGGLTLINVVDAGADPAHVATDRTGRFLLTAYYVAAKVTVHRIGDNGALSEKPLQRIAIEEGLEQVSIPDSGTGHRQFIGRLSDETPHCDIR